MAIVALTTVKTAANEKNHKTMPQKRHYFVQSVLQVANPQKLILQSDEAQWFLSFFQSDDRIEIFTSKREE